MSTTPSAAEIRALYDDLYARGAYSLSSAFADKYAMLDCVLAPLVSGRHVVDLGCGTGKLALMLARSAHSVLGLDASPPGIAMARTFAAALGARNVTFSVADIEAHLPTADVIVCAGVLEHLAAPAETLQAMCRAAPTVVVQVPSFLNPRGVSWHALAHVMGLPMTRSDRSQITEGWLRAHLPAGRRLARTWGSHYRLGWGDRMVTDLAQRIPAALRDAEASGDVAGFLAFLRALAERHAGLLSAWYAAGRLLPVPSPPTLAVPPGTYLSSSAVDWLNGRGEVIEPWYSADPVIARLGASTTYLVT